MTEIEQEIAQNMEHSELTENRREVSKDPTLFIKKVAIKDFLTYKDFTLDTFSQKCNLVLGKNGSGKSSFLKAIIYVLSDRYSNWTKQQKRGLLNNIAQQTSGRGSRTYWVEITLDNSQHRIPYNATEIAIKKSYNCETDREDYHINGQPITPKDLTNLLESANFSLSSSSQFQIVEQGKVQNLVDQGEQGFLEMLKQVTGTSQFDVKIGGMSKSIQDTSAKKDQLRQVLTQIKEKLSKLKDEIDVFNGYDKAEKDKKAMEKCLYFQKI